MAVAFKRGRGAIVLLALAAIIALPFSSAASDATRNNRATLDGQLALMHADDFAGGRSVDVHAVLTDDGKYVETDVSRLRGVDRLIGKRVQLAGEAAGSEFVATAEIGSPDTSTTAEATATTATATNTRRTAVILFNFTNDTSQPWTRVVRIQHRLRTFGISRRLLSRGLVRVHGD